jgi:hypothetical protein
VKIFSKLKVTTEPKKSLNIDSKSNSDLTKVMDFLREDFDETKDIIIDLTKHLDNIEKMYDLIHNEFKRRTNG